MRIKEVRIRDLYRFACEVARGSARGVLPITKQRALSQTKNPYADGREVGLVAAYEGERCVGFSGMMPGLLKHGSRLIKVSWGSAIFVDPESRQSMLGLRLLTQWSGLFNGTLSSSLEAVVAPLGQKIKPVTYYRIHGSTRARNGKTAQEARRTQRRLFEAIVVRAVPRIDEEETRERYGADSTVFYRDHRAINWMLRFPWIRELKPGEPDSRYVFSDARDVFRYEALRVYSARSGAYKGFLVLSVSSSGAPRYTVLKLLDFHFPSRGDKRFLLPIVHERARDCQAHAIEVSRAAGRSLPGSILALQDVLTIRRPVYFASNGAALSVPLSSIQGDYCDGDATFS